MRVGKRIVTVIILSAAGTALLVPTPAAARTYTYCGTVDTASRTCGPQNLWGAIWDKPKYGRTKYKLCVAPPGGGKDCNRHDAGRRGYDAVQLYGRYGATGTYVIEWRTGGHLIDRDSLHLTGGEGDRASAPGIKRSRWSAL